MLYNRDKMRTFFTVATDEEIISIITEDKAFSRLYSAYYRQVKLKPEMKEALKIYLAAYCEKYGFTNKSFKDRIDKARAFAQDRIDEIKVEDSTERALRFFDVAEENACNLSLGELQDIIFENEYRDEVSFWK